MFVVRGDWKWLDFEDYSRGLAISFRQRKILSWSQSPEKLQNVGMGVENTAEDRRLQAEYEGSIPFTRSNAQPPGVSRDQPSSMSRTIRRDPAL